MKTIDFRKKNIFPRILLTALLVSVLISSWVIQAAGLGTLTVGSYLGQPLKAEIGLVSVKDEEVHSLSAKLASPEAFKQAGIGLAPYHSTLSVSIEKRTDGQPYIRVSSPQAINEPFLNLLIELNWSAGRLLREYTILLDPAETQKAASAPPVMQSRAASVPTDDSSVSPIQNNTPSAVGQSPVTSRRNSADWTGNTYGPVNHGDTLTRIARQITPENVDLNQMLVALYRANRDAFLERNMNLLKVGVILRIPDQSEISSITPREAVREVRVQTDSWNTYRQRIADIATSAPGNTGSKQSQTGKITTISEDTSTTGATPPDEVLILSKGELLGSDQSTIKESDSNSAQRYLRMMEEDAIAKERALQEANERVAMLEQNIAKLQRLLELKGATSDTQAPPESGSGQIQSEPVQAEQTSQIEITPETSAPIVQTPEGSVLPEFTIPAQSINIEPLVNPIQPPDPESDEPALLDTLTEFTTENVELVGGSLAALLAIWLGTSIVRRRKGQADDFSETEAYGSTETGAGLTASTLFTDTSSDSATPANAEIELIQPTVGQPGFQPTGDDDKDTPLANPSFFFGRKLDEPTPEGQYFDENSPKATVEYDEISGESDMLGDNKIDTENTIADLAETEKASTDIQPDSEEEKWDFSGYTIDLDNEADGRRDDDSTKNDGLPQDNREIEFKLDLPADTSDSSQEESRPSSEISGITPNFADIDLNLGDEPELITGVDQSGEKNIQRQEVATKIDLARAYLEMDDKEGARDILEEVLREGDEEQQSIARSMLNEIG